ncbi:MAG: ACP S-malonyltransferase [Bacteroidota bacterium]|nr:ACP S-malonyltransferase [Bacteroidota bacterium]MDP4234359.1 ACP S-malonyltransferase [Bacteroidota bacterium]MDP4243292.1 ACP S-malonyltransferase [Bacteroidota bacterium]MDP4287977.1 ACP S-malonyltransferase [Bacteroidota bacterium]
MIAHIFPGQGSQYPGMVKEFAEAFPAARARLQEADDLLHINLSRAMLEGPEDVLRQTDYTQPAIFLHSIIALEFDEERAPAQAMAGHSLGEYTALCAAGGLEFRDALSLVHLRGQLMAEAGRRKSGTMAAIIGMDANKLTAICETVESELETVVRPANFNSPGQIVISGTGQGVQEVMRRAKAEGVRIAKELSVSGAFHSPLMQYAADGLQEALASTDITSPDVPVFSNVSAEPVEDAEDIRRLLIEQLTAPVLWEQSVKNMYDFGIREFVEYGPGKVLQGLITRTLTNVKVTGVEKPKAVAA